MEKYLKRIIKWCMEKLHKDQPDIKCPRCKLWATYTGGTYQDDLQFIDSTSTFFTCGHCEHKSEWNFSIAPVAIMIDKGDMK